MKKMLLMLAVAVWFSTAASAKENVQGTIVSENSVPCGTEAKGKKQTVEMMCQEYVIRTDTTEYHVRQEKQQHKALLPMNAPVELTLHKDRMKLKVNGKEYEMLIVSESGVPAAGTTPTPPPHP